jgi:hypothetical protein
MAVMNATQRSETWAEFMREIPPSTNMSATMLPRLTRVFHCQPGQV